MPCSAPRRGRGWIVSCLAALAPAAVSAADPAVVELPLERVVLFTSGVGYFQHAGTVTGDATIEMAFRADAVNDLLKSMVVEDLGGGTVPAVGYASRDPITKTLGTFAIDLTDDPSIGRILSRLRGERIEVEAATPATGTIVGVERRMVPVGDDRTAEKEFITLLTPEGLRTLPLDGITRIRLLDERLQRELEQALAVLALGHDAEKKSVALAFRGAGERPVRVGYVQEAPMWKTSYRLVLADGAGGREGDGDSDGDAAGPQAGRALLQGWAIVENTTDRDWSDVRMALVSGRPISFVMDLYQPLYVPRPVVELEQFASLAPQVYGQDLSDRDRAAGLPDARQPASGLAEAAPATPRAMARRARNEGPLGDRSGLSAAGMSAIGSVALGESLGDLFRYEIAGPVTIPRQRSAMLPIVSEQVAAEKVAVYDDRVLAKHPLSGVRLVNSTGLDLMQGPITVYAAGAYAGDGRIEDLPAGSSRLVTYAVALDLEVNPRSEPRPEEIVSVKIAKGTLVASRRLVRRKLFEAKNSGAELVTLLVEHPREEGWALVEPKEPAETTRDRFRFAIEVGPGEPATLVVAEERLVAQRLVLTDLDDGQILFYSTARSTSPAVRQALGEVLERKRAIQRAAEEVQRSDREIQAVGEEQERIRQNMAQLDRGSDLYTRYVQKFTAQEDRIETLRKQRETFELQEQDLRRGLDALLVDLELD